MLLTGLKQLQKLDVCTDKNVRKEILDRFWAVLRQQKQQS
jgi:hypothetical protein